MPEARAIDVVHGNLVLRYLSRGRARRCRRTASTWWGALRTGARSIVPAREWMRICFELLEMLKAHKKGIRRATVNTFGYIAKAIGPQVCSPL